MDRKQKIQLLKQISQGKAGIEVLKGENQFEVLAEHEENGKRVFVSNTTGKRFSELQLEAYKRHVINRGGKWIDVQTD